MDSIVVEIDAVTGDMTDLDMYKSDHTDLEPSFHMITLRRIWSHLEMEENGPLYIARLAVLHRFSDMSFDMPELDSLPGVTPVTFNYRGSGNNKGTPSEKTFSPDSKEILECATQVNGTAPKFIAGRGTGAILAFNNSNSQTRLILIDPVESIADALVYKYGFLYPKFLVRAGDAINTGKNGLSIDQIGILLDRSQFSDRGHIFAQKFQGATVWKRDGGSFRAVLTKIMQSPISD